MNLKEKSLLYWADSNIEEYLLLRKCGSENTTQLLNILKRATEKLEKCNKSVRAQNPHTLIKEVK